MLGPSNMISLIAMASSIKRTCILSPVLNRVLREREGVALHRVGLLKYFKIYLRWYGTLNMDQKVCLNMLKKDQLCAIAVKKRN